MLTLKNHTTADRVGASYACCLLLFLFKSHSDFLNIQLSFWGTAHVERPLFILSPKKPKMPDVWVDVFGKGTRNDAAKIMSSFSPFLSPIICPVMVLWRMPEWTLHGDSYFQNMKRFFPCNSVSTMRSTKTWQSYKELNTEGDFVTYLS